MPAGELLERARGGTRPLGAARSLTDVIVGAPVRTEVRARSARGGCGWAALQDRIDADLALGRHVGADRRAGRRSSRKEPHRERLRGQLMLALYRAGRQPGRPGRLPLGTWEATRRARARAPPGAALRKARARQILTQDETARAGLVTTATLGPGQGRGTLPVPATPFLGRERERSELAELLAGGEGTGS